MFWVCIGKLKVPILQYNLKQSNMIKLNKKSNRWYTKTEAHGWKRISASDAQNTDLNEVGKVIESGYDLIFILWS